jgi:tRNA A37 threonylcarbamoyltransferase TsaD
MQWAGRCAIDVVKLEDRKLKERRSRKRSESMTPVCTAMRHDGVCRTIYDAAIQSASTDRQSVHIVCRCVKPGLKQVHRIVTGWYGATRPILAGTTKPG